MAAKVLLKRTSVAGRVPNTSTLDTGELALNMTDGILYSTNGSIVFEIGANLTNLSVTGNTTFGNTRIIANGSVGTAGYVLTTGGTNGNVYWSEASSPVAGSNTEVQFNDNGDLGASNGFTFDKTSNNLTVSNTITANALTVNNYTLPLSDGSNGYVITTDGAGQLSFTPGAGAGFYRDSFVGNGANTEYTLTRAPFNSDHLLVFVDRILQLDTDYTIAGATVTFDTAPDDQSPIDIFVVRSSAEPFRGVTRNEFTGNGTNTQFTLAANSSGAAYTLVFVDTVFQPTSEYTIANNVITFNSAPADTVGIEVVQLGTGFVSDGITPPGANDEILFNEGGFYSANNKFKFNNSTTTLSVGSNLTVNTSTIFIGNSTVNTTIIAGNINLQGTQLSVGNVVVTGEELTIGNTNIHTTGLTVGNVTIHTSGITVGNSTVNTVIGQTGDIAGNGSQLTSVDAITVEGNTVSDILISANTLANTLAAAAYTNAASYADTKAGNAYTNAVAYAASNSYVNETFLQLAGGTITGDLVVSGNVFFNGTTTNVNSTNLVVEDKNIIVGDVATPSDVTADGGGITLKGSTDKTITWVDSTDAWTSSEDFNLVSGKSYEINGTVVVNSTSLGTGITGSSLTSVGTLTTLAAGNTTITGFANVSTTLQVAGLATLGSNASINSSATACKLELGSANQTQWSDLIIRSDTGSGEIFRGGSGYSSYSGTAGLNIYNSNSSAGHIGFFPGGTSSAVLLAAANGNVGIGTTAPSGKLHVSGTIIIDGSGNLGLRTFKDGSNSISSHLYLANFDNNKAFNWQLNSDGSALDFWTYNGSWNNRITYTATGNVGIGTTSPTDKIDIRGNVSQIDGSPEYHFGTTSASHYNWRIAAQEVVDAGFEIASGTLTAGTNASSDTYTTRFVIKGDTGNVGIGTTSPRNILDVNGGVAYFTRVGRDFILNPNYGEGNTHVQLQAGDGMQLRLASNGDIDRVTIDTNGNVGIGTTNPSYKLEVNGSFAATTKSFVIDHPTKPDKKLRYGSLEGPENGVYVRGKLTGSNTIELPDYWIGLVHEDSITVNLTPIGKHQNLYVKSISDNKVTIGGCRDINCFYTVFAERKDVEKLIVEYPTE